MRHGGSLLGLAIGDALGAPLEGLSRPPVLVTEMLPGGLHPRRAGDVTDDTLQALALAESLALCGRFDADDLMQRLIRRWRETPEWFGPTSTAVFERVAGGVSPSEAARKAGRHLHGSRTNGCVVRGFAAGIFYPPRDSYDVSLACSRLTHADETAGHASAFLNVMVSAMCRGAGRIDAFRMACSLSRDAEVSEVLGDWSTRAPDPSLDAVLCSHAALYSFMGAYRFEEALLNAVNLGGDSDTVGACCGALAGACFGLDAIPERWQSALPLTSRILLAAKNLWDARP